MSKCIYVECISNSAVVGCVYWNTCYTIACIALCFTFRLGNQEEGCNKEKVLVTNLTFIDIAKCELSTTKDTHHWWELLLLSCALKLWLSSPELAVPHLSWGTLWLPSGHAEPCSPVTPPVFWHGWLYTDVLSQLMFPMHAPLQLTRRWPSSYSPEADLAQDWRQSKPGQW